MSTKKKGPSKGSAFERDICRSLSLWWTGGEDDAVFWRTGASGGRATTRSKIGKYTVNQGGDIAATNPVGRALTDLVSIELKRGYSKDTLFDCVDKSAQASLQTYESWIVQARLSAQSSRAKYWMIIHKRDRRQAAFLTPVEFLTRLLGAHASGLFSRCLLLLSREHDMLACAPFKEFLERVRPETVAAMAADDSP